MARPSGVVVEKFYRSETAEAQREERLISNVIQSSLITLNSLSTPDYPSIHIGYFNHIVLAGYLVGLDDGIDPGIEGIQHRPGL